MSRSRLRFVCAALAAAALCCGAEPEEALPPGGTNPPPPPPGPVMDPTEALFAPDRVFRVEIEVAPEDWDTLRSQSRNFFEVIGGEGCLDAPFGSPFTYVKGKVTIDGEAIEDVGVRKKGFFGSLSEEHPSLKLNFDEYVEGQRFSGFERMTLNNVQQDPAAVRQCLAYSLYTAAGVPAPRCAFASVAVNGQELGIYAHVDSMKKRFLRRHFEDDEGDLWEGTLSDFRTGWNGTFEQKTNREVPASRDRLLAITQILESDMPDVSAAIGEYLDLDRFYAYWTTESLIGFWDGYGGNTNNFFLYDDPVSNRLVFMPWGVDSCFVDDNPFLEGAQPPSVMAQGMLTRRLYTTPAGRARYVDEMRRILAEVWDESALTDEITRLEVMLTPHVQTRRAAGWLNAFGELRGFVRERRATVEAELDMGGYEWTIPLRETFCIEPIASVSASFETSFGTHPSPNLFNAGSGTLEVVLPETTVTGSGIGAASGFGTGADDAGDAVVLIIGQLPDGAYGLVYLALAPDELTPGARIELDGTVNRGALLRIERLGQQPQLIGLLVDAQVELQTGAPTDGAAMIGSVVGDVYPFGG